MSIIKILNLNENYSEDELKKAYRKAVIENHPDKYQDETEKKQATERMKKINEAYGFLKKYNNTSKNQKFTCTVLHFTILSIIGKY